MTTIPYIKPEDRIRYDRPIAELILALANSAGANPGHLNYIITKLIHEFLPMEPKYADLNEVVGVLGCVKASLIETVLFPYEKEKMKENGHISDLDQGYHDDIGETQ